MKKPSKPIFLTESESIEATYFLLKIEKRSFFEVYN